MKNAKPIEVSFLDKEMKKYLKDDKNTIIRHALSGSSIDTVCKNQDSSNETDYSFSIDIKTMPATNQKQSGRCWIFAATNVLREVIGKKLGLDNFELSQSYIAFYDKLEKVNFELEAIIDLIGKEYDDRTLTHITSTTIGDGGQWDMFINIVNKYGVVPKNQMIETFQSSSTGALNKLISVELKKFASVASEIYREKGMGEVRRVKDELLNHIYYLLVSSYGVPPKKFDFEYVDKDKKYHLVKGFTPLKFYEKYFKEEANKYVSIINAPTNDKPFNKSYTIDYLGNVVGGKIIKHLNLSMDRMIELIINQLKDGRIVWFGSDVGFYRDRQSYIWDDKAFDFDTPFKLNYYVDKGKALDYSISAMGHAMCITGVNIQNGKPTKWKIENSWGTDIAKSGYHLMSDSWFRQYVYQAVVDRCYLTEEELKEYESDPIVLKPWDPMGSLAD